MNVSLTFNTARDQWAGVDAKRRDEGRRKEKLLEGREIRKVEKEEGRMSFFCYMCGVF